jgi:hypothetical protein
MRIDLRPILALVAVAAALLLVASAHAEPIRPDTAPVDPSPGAFSLSIGGDGLVRDGRVDLGFFVAIGGRFDVIVDRATSSRRALDKLAVDDDRFEDLDDRGAKRGGKGKVEDPPAEASPAGEPPAQPGPGPRVIDGATARGLVHAALAADRSAEDNDRIDSLATRARVSALLPELRFRIGHDVGEGESVSPTEYDPDRLTTNGTSSLWLEGRATFRLDRLVFADDEVQIERLRAERAKEDRLMTDRILGLIRQWEEAEMVLTDPGLVDPDVRARAEVDQIAAEASLDVLTNGWFNDHRSAMTPK